MDYTFEHQAHEQGFQIVCGVDEAGRGPLAGPVCAAAVILPDGLVIEGLDDSKKLTEKKRDALYDVICEEAISYGIAFASVEEIEEMNILQATFLAMKRAVESLNVKADLALVDGNQKPPLDIQARTLVKGDAKSPSIAAASILAKVTRDRLMVEIAEQYPQYEFSKHKGYGTKLHYEKIMEHGISPVHRRSFLKKITGEK
ncbi:MAG: ribonuclease HII [Ruminococcaceae bacterium]|nr:ribonuclease HII [Oscillospiraceae bacterium]